VPYSALYVSTGANLFNVWSTHHRDGVRLARLVEILLHDWSLSKKLRVPPRSLLQKRHNVEVMLCV